MSSVAIARNTSGGIAPDPVRRAEIQPRRAGRRSGAARYIVVVVVSSSVVVVVVVVDATVVVLVVLVVLVATVMVPTLTAITRTSRAVAVSPSAEVEHATFTSSGPPETVAVPSSARPLRSAST